MNVRKKRWFFVCLIICFFVPFSGQAKDVEKTFQVITVVLDDNYPPFIFRDSSGDIHGILVDEWKLWEKKAGIKVNLIAMDWNKAQDLLLRGQADVIDTLFFTEERAKQYDFTKPYEKIEVPIFHHKDLSGIVDIASLQGFTIGVKTGDACIEVLNKGGITSLKKYNSYESIVQAAVDRQIKVFSIDKPPALYYLHKNKIENEFHHAFNLYTGEFHRAVKKGRAALLKIVEDGFALISNREHDAIKKKWMGESLARPEYLRYVIFSFLICGFLISGLVLFNMILRKKIRSKTSELNDLVNQLQVSEEQFRSMFDQAAVGVALCESKSGKYINVNQRYCDIVGYSQPEICQLSFQEITHPDDLQDDLDNMKLLLEGKIRDFAQEKRYCRKDGAVVWVKITVSPIRTHGNDVVVHLAIVENIAEQKKVEEAIRESEAKYKSLTNNLNIGVYRNTPGPEGRFIEANPAIVTMFGFGSREEFLKIAVADLYKNPDERKAFAAKIAKKSTIRNEELQLQKKDGTSFIGAVSAVAVKDEKGDIKYIDGIIEDVTERKRARHRLEKEFTAIIAVMDNMLHGEADDAKTEEQVLDACLTATDSVYGMIGIVNEHGKYDTTTYSSRSLQDCAFPEALAWEVSTGMTIRGVWGNPMLQGKPLLCNDLQTHPDRIGFPKGHVPINCFLGAPLIRDKKVMGMVAVANKPGGYTKRELETLIRLTAVISVSRQYRMTLQLAKSTSAELEQLVKARTSELLQANENMKREIDERMLAKGALRESEEKYRSMMEAMSDGAYICSSDFRIEYMNPAMIKKIGRDATGERCHKAIHELDQKCPWCAHKKVQQGISLETDIVSPKNSRSYHVSHAPIIHKDRSISKMTVYRDTTDLKQMELQLQQAQKMESIGTLAGGIAHDFNNILFPMFGYLEMMLMDMEEENPLRRNLDAIYNSAKRARDLVKQILIFSRQTEHEKKPLKVQLVIKEVLKLIRSLLPTTIEIHQDISDECGLVMADPAQIHQIAMNLMTNAYHAMEEAGGMLTVKLKEVVLTDEDLKDSTMVQGQYVCLTIADTGLGMDKSMITRIFDPYFTTKEKGKGTGLGLAVVHGIVKSHDGNINVSSEPGKGTEFQVYLPMIKSEKVEKIATTDLPLQKGNERILLVDDEVMIVQMGREMLERLGYQVTVRTSSTEALEAFRVQPNRFDMVITDMTMPNMTGDILTGELLKIRPDIPVILCTGFSEKISAGKVASLGLKGFLMKPIIIKDLSRLIRDVLDSD